MASILCEEFGNIQERSISWDRDDDDKQGVIPDTESLRKLSPHQ